MAKDDSVEKAAEKTGKDAEEAARKAAKAAKSEADSLLAELQPALDALSDRVHALTEGSKELALDAGHHTRDSVLDARDHASACVAERPLQSVAVAAAVGTVIGWLLSRR